MPRSYFFSFFFFFFFFKEDKMGEKLAPTLHVAAGKLNPLEGSVPGVPRL